MKTPVLIDYAHNFAHNFARGLTLATTGFLSYGLNLGVIQSYIYRKNKQGKHAGDVNVFFTCTRSFSITPTPYCAHGGVAC